MNSTQEDAVSPVIGVMLMLAITIIIAFIVACIVSVFAGGFSFDAKQIRYPQISSLLICTWTILVHTYCLIT